MPHADPFSTFSEATDRISNAALQYINARREKAKQEQAWNNLTGFLKSKYNQEPTVQTKQPGTGGGTTPQIPTTLQPATTTPGRDVGPELDMLKSMGAVPMSAYEAMTKRYTPQYQTVRGGQGEVRQFPENPETGQLDVSQGEEVTPPIMRQTAPKPQGDKVGRVQDKDGIYYDVFVDPQTKTADYVKSQIQGPQKTVAGGGPGGVSPDQAEDIANAIMSGKQPPDMKGMYRFSGPVKASLAKKGFDLTTAERDWQAIQKHVATLNGQQQERLRQAITFTNETLPQIEDAYAEWKKQAGISGYKIINKGTLATMANLPGKAGSAAANLQSLIADFTSELGTVYKGGNSSTDESLALAAKNLSADWNEQTFNDAMSRLRRSIQIRYNSIINSKPAGVSPGSKYMPKSETIPSDEDIGKMTAEELKAYLGI